MRSAGRLAAAGRSDEDHELAVLDLEVEVVDGDDLAVLFQTWSNVTVAIGRFVPPLDSGHN